MGKLNKSESKGLLVFSVLGVLVMIIGILMNIFHQNTRGRVAPMYGGEIIASLSGRDIIWVGGIMLAMALLLYLSISKEDKAE